MKFCLLLFAQTLRSYNRPDKHVPLNDKIDFCLFLFIFIVFCTSFINIGYRLDAKDFFLILDTKMFSVKLSNLIFLFSKRRNQKLSTVNRI